MVNNYKDEYSLSVYPIYSLKGNWDTASVKNEILIMRQHNWNFIKNLVSRFGGLGTWFKINLITYNKEYSSQSSFTTTCSSVVLKILALDKHEPKDKIRFTYNPPPIFVYRSDFFFVLKRFFLI